jgi:aldose 1-epimerase
VRNVGTAPVPFGVGAHPYLRAGYDATDDCELTLAAALTLPLEGGLPTGPSHEVSGELDFRAGLPLKGRTLDNAFGGCTPADGDDVVRHRLTGPTSAVEVWADPDFGWVQVFTPADHPGRGRAVAVEPMTCPPDGLNSGIGLITLAPGEQWTGSWGIRPL